MNEEEAKQLFESHIRAQDETAKKNKEKALAVENEDYALADSLKKQINTLKTQMLTGSDLKNMLSKRPAHNLREMLELMLMIDQSVHFTDTFLDLGSPSKDKVVAFTLTYLKQTSIGLERLKQDVAEIVNSINQELIVIEKVTEDLVDLANEDDSLI